MPSSQATPGYVALDAVELEQLAQHISNVTRPPSTDGEIASLYASLTLPAGTPSIRLLQLDAAVDDDHAAPLTGTMRVVRLDNEPCYTALSYVWGSFASPPDTITCNGGVRLRISVSCREALVELRKLFGGITIWIDAICINQVDISDKNVQIPLMGDIYTWAQATYIWLGPGTSRTRAAMDWLRSASRVRLSMKNLQMASAATRSLAIPGRILVSCWNQMQLYFKTKNTVAMHEYDVQDLQEFLMTPWLTRAWTFQEMVLSPNPIFVCGNQVIGWDKFIRGVHLLLLHRRRRQWSFLYYIREDVLPPVLRPIWSYMHGMNSLLLPQDKPPALKPWLSLVHIWMAGNRPSCWHRGSIRRLSGGRPEYPSSLLAFLAGYVDDIESFVWSYIFAAAVTLVLTAPGLFLMYNEILSFSGDTQFAVVSCFFGGIFFVINDACRFHRDLHMYAPLLPGIGHQKQLGATSDQTSVLLEGIVHALRKRGATDPLDRSYALTGVLGALGISLTSAANYGKTKGRVYHDLLVGMMRWRPSTISLLMDVRPERLADAPSWVPDWHLCASRSIWFPDAYLINAGKEPWRASGARILADFSDGGHRLRVQAQDTSVIHSVFGPFGDFSKRRPAESNGYLPQPLAAVEQLMGWFRQARVRARATWLYGSLAVVMYRILQAHDTSAKDVPGEFNVIYASLLAALDLPTTTKSDGSAAESVATRSFAEALSKDDKYFNLAETLFRKVSTEDRCLLITEDGLLGTGPIGLQAGDVVALVAGIPTPFGLRTVGSPSENRAGVERERYQALGPLYIEGLMKGELAEGRDARDVYLI